MLHFFKICVEWNKHFLFSSSFTNGANTNYCDTGKTYIIVTFFTDHSGSKSPTKWATYSSIRLCLKKPSQLVHLKSSTEKNKNRRNSAASKRQRMRAMIRIWARSARTAEKKERVRAWRGERQETYTALACTIDSNLHSPYTRRSCTRPYRHETDNLETEGHWDSALSIK